MFGNNGSAALQGRRAAVGRLEGLRATTSRVSPVRPEIAMKTPLCATLAVVVLAASSARADPLSCNLSGYKPVAGLAAAVADNTLSITWDGDRSDQLRLHFIVESGAPVIQELAVRKKGGAWAVLATHILPD